MKISKVIEEILSSQFASNLPLGAEYDKDAPYNQTDAIIRKGEIPNVSDYSVVWYGHNAGISILKDKSGKLYTFNYEIVNNEDFEPYADREEIYTGKDEDGFPEFDYGDWELDGEVIERYINDNTEKYSVAYGKSAYDEGEDLVEIDGDLKEELLDMANKYIKDNKEWLIKTLSSYEPQINESFTISEAKLSNEPFVKVYFEYDFPSSENRLKLINIIKDYFGEPLSKGREDKYWSTFIPELELEEFLSAVGEFNPQPTSVTIQASRFKPLSKELKDGDIIKFFDYTVSENDPPRTEGYLKPGFIQRNRSLMKWEEGRKEAWIDNSMVDKYYFYHGDVSDIKGHPGSKDVDSKFVKIFFDDDMLNRMSAEQEDELRKIIKDHRGQLRYVFGGDKASGGQRYTLVPKELADDFIQAAYDFGAYEAETERNIRLEDKSLNEIRKIVRGVINNVIK
jgi:hypothetical protein